jgi:hypothetical protein
MEIRKRLPVGSANLRRSVSTESNALQTISSFEYQLLTKQYQ